MPVAPFQVAAVGVAATLLCLALSACGDSSKDTVAAASSTPAGTPVVTPDVQPTTRTPGTKGPHATPTPRPREPGPSTAGHAALGADFVLRQGESVAIDGTHLVVTFTRLLEDSRCPTNVTCIQQGQARIAVTLRQNGSPSTFELVVPATGGAEAASNEQRLGRFVVHLESVDPWPVEPGAAKADPTAKLRVSRV